MNPTIEVIQAALAWLAARTGWHERAEAGLTTTEVAVLTGLMVSAAVVVSAIILAAAKAIAGNIGA
ncbi:MAG TPA: hypothetical protein VFJ85_15300 [Acidimicrobiales bacterium]|nr:hypothetical protein [Acidimicrobiales bacterium]